MSCEKDPESNGRDEELGFGCDEDWETRGPVFGGGGGDQGKYLGFREGSAYG